MYFLAKLCRICVKNKENLITLDTVDYDNISLSEKLKICTKMVVKPQKEVSKEICTTCVKKLRISFEFLSMCKKSSAMLNGYITKLVNDQNNIESSQFSNTSLYIALTNAKVPHRKRRVGKSERCAAMQKLMNDKPRGGLKDLLSFTKSFDFGYSPCSVQPPDNSPLDKLIAFSENFFYEDFNGYRKSILEVIESSSNENSEDTDESDIEDMFKSFEEDEDEPFDSKRTKFEEVILPTSIKTEMIDENGSEEFIEMIHCKIERGEYSNCGDEDCINNNMPIEYFDFNKSDESRENLFNLNGNLLGGLYRQSKDEHKTCSLSESSDRGLKNRKFFDISNISPNLQKQYLMRNFQCDTCNRKFKSLGYLKAHNSKMHNTCN